MVIGNGLLATAFDSYKEREDIIIFASGVADSNTTDESFFNREASMLKNIIKKYPCKQIVYFSSCALCCKEFLDLPYYKHKAKMEELVSNLANYSLIIRLPQAFGVYNNPKQLIGFFIDSIKKNKPFYIIKNARRYLIDVEDVVIVVTDILKYKFEKSTIINIANPYPYPVEEIVKILEALLGIKAIYSKKDSNTQNIDLDLDFMKEYIKNTSLLFGKDYFRYRMEGRCKKN